MEKNDSRKGGETPLKKIFTNFEIIFKKMLTLVFFCCNVPLGIEKHILKRGFRKMKKLIAILAVMIVLVGAVFAADGDKLKLQSIVGEVLPVYEIHADNDSSTDVAGTQAGATVTTRKDISTENIEWDFVIKQIGELDGQNNSVTFAKTKKTATLTITLGHFTGAEEAQVANDNPVFTAFDAVEFNQANSAVAQNKQTVVTVPAQSAWGSNTATVTLAYKGVNWADQDVVTFSAEWTKDNTLKMDTYYATITLEYSAQ